VNPLGLRVPPGVWDVDDGSMRRIGCSTRSAWAALFVPLCVALGFGGVLLLERVRQDPGLCIPAFMMILVSLTLLPSVAMLCCGKFELRLRGTQTEVSSGIGRLGRTVRFDLAEFDSVGEDRYAWWRSREGNLRFGPRRPPRVIVLEGARRVSFGRYVPHDVRRYVLNQLDRLLHALPTDGSLVGRTSGGPR
jgi:hypothetical protein